MTTQNGKCPFCNVEEGREIILSSTHCIAFHDGFPVSEGHTLIVPKRHVSDFFDLSEEEAADMYKCAVKVKGILSEKFHPDGFNVGVNVGKAAGQSVFHVHMHIIPRYEGDVPHPRGGVRGVIPAKQNY